jgi:hypothetical protein
VLGQQVSVANAAVAPAAGLPDGRAYEQVSPVDKNGTNTGGQVAQIAAAPDGRAINFLTSSGIPGGEGAQEYPTYVARRGAESWSTEGMLPPASLGAIQAQILGWSTGFTKTYLKSRNSITEPFNLQQLSTPGSSTTSIPGVGSAVYLAGQSDGGELVVFESPEAIGSLPAEPYSNVYGWDPSTGQVSLISVNNERESAAELSVAGPYGWFNGQEWESGGATLGYYTEQQHVVAADGSGVVFTADLEPPQVFVRRHPLAEQSQLDGQGECTEAALACTLEISASQRQVLDPEGEQPAQFQYASANGSDVFFTSAGKLTDDATTGEEDEGSDLYRYEVSSRILTDLTPDTEAVDPDGAEVLGVLGGSEEGSYLYFLANGVLGDGASEGAAHGTCGPLRGVAQGISGVCNLYVWHNGQINYIAQLHPENEGVGSASDIYDIAPVAYVGGGDIAPAQARVTPDGRTAVFRSAQSLTGYENEGVPEYYRYVYDQVGVRCLTCNPAGSPPSSGPSLSSLTVQRAPREPAAQQSRNLSGSGDRFFFESTEGLLPADTNGIRDVYEWEAPDAAEPDDTCTESSPAYVPPSEGCLYLISPGTGTRPSYFADASDDGDDAFFYTAQPLVAQDKDELVDIYDARVGGGIPSQEEGEPAQCAGGDCKGSVQSTPSQQAARNASAAAAGNVTPLKCRKGLVIRHGKCVKQKKAKHKHHVHHEKKHPRRHKKNKHGMTGSAKPRTGKSK